MTDENYTPSEEENALEAQKRQMIKRCVIVVVAGCVLLAAVFSIMRGVVDVFMMDKSSLKIDWNAPAQEYKPKLPVAPPGTFPGQQQPR